MCKPGLAFDSHLDCEPHLRLSTQLQPMGIGLMGYQNKQRAIDQVPNEWTYLGTDTN